MCCLSAWFHEKVGRTYTKYLRPDRRFLSPHASSSSFASSRRSTCQLSAGVKGERTYIELPGEGCESALSIDEWQDLLREQLGLFDDDQSSSIVPPYDLYVSYW